MIPLSTSLSVSLCLLFMSPSFVAPLPPSLLLLKRRPHGLAASGVGGRVSPSTACA